MDAIERTTPGRVAIGAAIGLAVAVAIGAAFWPAGVAAAIGVLGVAVAVGQIGHRRRKAPLEIAATALRTDHLGAPRFRFRARLGSGRIVGAPTARVTFAPDGGSPVPLRVVDAGVPRLVGAFTVFACPDVDWSDGPGRFDVVVSVREGDRVWESRRSFRSDDVRPGRFGADVVRVGDRVRQDRALWDRVVPDTGT